MTQEELFLETELDLITLQLSSNSKEYRDYVNSFLTKELLAELLMKYSCNYICKNILSPKGYTISAGTLIDKCKRFGLRIKTLQEQASSQQVRSQYKNTCLHKYGKTNALSKDTSPYLKRNSTVENKYGVVNVFQLSETKLKSKETLFEKYGVNNPIELAWHKKNNGRRSLIHKQIESFLNEKQICFKSEQSGFSKHNTFFNKRYSPIVDILLCNKKLIVEIYGDYWHGNPKKYKAEDLVYRYKGITKVKDIWEEDYHRIEQLKSFGYDVHIIWEKDIKQDLSNTLLKLYEKCKD